MNLSFFCIVIPLPGSRVIKSPIALHTGTCSRMHTGTQLHRFTGILYRHACIETLALFVITWHNSGTLDGRWEFTAAVCWTCGNSVLPGAYKSQRTRKRGTVTKILFIISNKTLVVLVALLYPVHQRLKSQFWSKMFCYIQLESPTD